MCIVIAGDRYDIPQISTDDKEADMAFLSNGTAVISAAVRLWF
jgi:hypothetical protein